MSATGDDEPKRSLEEITEELYPLLGRGKRTGEERRKHIFRCGVQRTCSHCADCERPLAPDEPIWRQKLNVSHDYYGRPTYWIFPVCKQCSHAMEGVFRKPRPCEGCGRP